MSSAAGFRHSSEALLRERIASWTVCLLVFAIPWGDMLLFFGGVPASRLLTIAVALGWVFLLRGEYSIRSPVGAHWFMAAFFVWAIAGTFTEVVDGKGGRRLLSYYQLMLDSWLIFQLVRTAEQYRTILQAYVLGACVPLAGLGYRFVQGVTLGDGRYTAPGFDPNDLAGTLALGIPLACYLLVTRKRMQWLNGLYIPLAAVGILLTASRMGLVLVAMALLFVFFVPARISMGKRVATLALVLLSAGAVAAFQDDISTRRLATFNSELRSRDLNGRVSAWTRGLSVFLDNPFLGVGAGAYASAIAATGEQATAAHNVFLEVLAEHGSVGAALFMAIGISLWRRFRRAPSLDRRLCYYLLAMWVVTASALSWGNREVTWLLCGILTVVPRQSRTAQLPCHAVRVPRGMPALAGVP